MGKLVVCTNLTLDGAMQGPARPDEDTRDDFTQGGWAAPYAGMAHSPLSLSTSATTPTGVLVATYRSPMNVCTVSAL